MIAITDEMIEAGFNATDADVERNQVEAIFRAMLAVANEAASEGRGDAAPAEAPHNPLR